MSNPGTNTSTPAAVQLTRRGQHLVIRPPHEAGRRQLRSLVHRPAGDLVRGCSIRPAAVPLFGEEDGALLCWAGLEPVVTTILARCGCGAIKVERAAVAVTPTMGPAWLSSLIQAGRGLLRFDGQRV